MYPKHIKGTWRFGGGWFGNSRLVASNQDLATTMWEPANATCPICEYPNAISLDYRRKDFPSMCYCPECGSVWGWYVARCPDCDGLMANKTRQKNGAWGERCPDGVLICEDCGMMWDIESIKKINEDSEQGIGFE